MDVAKPGRSLSRDIRDIRRGEVIETDLQHFISARHDKRVKEEGEREVEEAWRETERKHAEKRRQQARHEWHLHHLGQAEHLRSALEELIADHDRRAEELLNGGGDAA